MLKTFRTLNFGIQICLGLGFWNLGDEIATPLARNDMRDHRTFPLASEAKMPPKQRTAKIMNAVFMLCWKSR